MQQEMERDKNMTSFTLSSGLRRDPADFETHVVPQLRNSL